MKKAAVFYFSGTGNTWWVTRRIVKLLEEAGWEAAAYSIEGVEPEQADAILQRCDVVGFGYPIYGSDVPEPMKEFMKALSPAEGKDTFIYCSQWMWSGDGARTGWDFLKGKGFKVRWGEHILMPNNVCVTVLPILPYTNDKEKINRKLGRAERKIQRLVSRMVKGRSFRRGFNLLSFLLGNIQRGPLRAAFDKLQDDVGVDSTKCIRCGKCAELCPVGNLLFDGETVKPQGKCILCIRCYNYCPVSAFTYMGRPHNMKRGKPYEGPVEGFDPKVLKE